MREHVISFPFFCFRVWHIQSFATTLGLNRFYDALLMPLLPKVPRRRAMFIVFTDTSKALEPISEGHEEEDDCEVRLEAPVTTATAYVSLSAPDAVEEHHDTTFQVTPPK